MLLGGGAFLGLNVAPLPDEGFRSHVVVLHHHAAAREPREEEPLRQLEDALAGRAVDAIVAGGDPARVQKVVRLLGYYNNAVHYCARYPRMRRGIAERALQQLATAPDAASFVSAYAKQAITMAREARFDLLEWTRVDDEAERAAA